ncbi:hypothetical protein ACROYT_G033490 [Oculina patagonica]
MDNCTSSNSACWQGDMTFEKGPDKKQHFEKGCLVNDSCEKYEKGDIELCNITKAQGITVDCKAKCCHEDECNKGNLLVENKGSFRQCSRRESEKSYEDCQNNLKVQNCTDKSVGCF